MLYSMLSGMLVMGCWIVGMFFIRYWRQSADRLFLLFGVSFWLLAIERAIPNLLAIPRDETSTSIYLIRLVAFVVILYAIVDKNRSRSA